jgi:8-oxo-dGTP pyrophosphatase MutT (NUDIX family)
MRAGHPTRDGSGQNSGCGTAEVADDVAQGLPDWLRPLAAATRALRADSWSTFEPPRGSKPREAAVLVLFGEGTVGPYVLLLERSHEMRSHAGQVAFPGGARDRDDANAVATALREAEEETGLDLAGVQVLATLPALWVPPSNYNVTPVVGWWHTPSDVRAVDPAETASVHSVPLNQLLDPMHRVTARHPSGRLGPAFLVGDLVVWGFTAGLLSRLFAIADWELPWDDGVVVDLPEPLAARSLHDLSRIGPGP